MTLDLPQPLGPTTPTRWPGSWNVVGSAKDLKPESLIWFRRMKANVAGGPDVKTAAFNAAVVECVVCAVASRTRVPKARE